MERFNLKKQNDVDVYVHVSSQIAGQDHNFMDS
jgi:hypothetical protein